MLLVGVLLLPFMMVTVHASGAPYAWVVGGETLGSGQSNTAATAKQVTDGKTVTLTLDNYKGGKIELTCYGTGQEGMKFIIELKGDNVITSDDVGIAYTYTSDLEFTGDGKLTVNAPTPASYSSEKNTLVIDKSSKATDTKEVEEDDDEEETETTGTDTLISTKEEDKNGMNDFILGVAVGFGVVLVVAIIVKLFTPKKVVVTKSDE